MLLTEEAKNLGSTCCGTVNYRTYEDAWQREDVLSEITGTAQRSRGQERHELVGYKQPGEQDIVTVMRPNPIYVEQHESGDPGLVAQ